MGSKGKAASKSKRKNCICSWKNCYELSQAFGSHHQWSGYREARPRPGQGRRALMKAAALRAGLCRHLGLKQGSLKERFYVAKHHFPLAAFGPRMGHLTSLMSLEQARAAAKHSGAKLEKRSSAASLLRRSKLN